MYESPSAYKSSCFFYNLRSLGFRPLSGLAQGGVHADRDTGEGDGGKESNVNTVYVVRVLATTISWDVSTDSSTGGGYGLHPLGGCGAI